MANNFDVKFEDREVAALVSTLIKRVNNPKPLLKTIERYIHAATSKMFRGRRPDKGAVRGVNWKKLSQKTIDQKKALMKRGKAIATRPLVRTGKLRDSRKVLQRSSRGFTYGTKTKSKKGFPYPGYHNTTRPWLFINRQDLRQITKIAIDFLKGRRKGFESYVK